MAHKTIIREPKEEKATESAPSKTVDTHHSRLRFFAVVVVAAALAVGCNGVKKAQSPSTPANPKAPVAPDQKNKAQSADTFDGNHENLQMGEGADWRSGFHLRLSDPHLAVIAHGFDNEGASALVLQLDIENDGAGQVNIPLKDLPCAARDLNGIPLKGASGEVREVYQAPQILSTPLEIGQKRSSVIGYELPQSGSEVTLKCSLPYATGTSNIMSGPEPSAGAMATWKVDTSELR